MPSSAFTGHLLTAFTIIVWGATFISSRLLLDTFAPIEVLFDRFFLGFVALWIVLPRRLGFKGFKNELLMVLAGFLGITLYFLCENVALLYTKTANVGVIIAAVPFFTGLVDRFLGSRNPLPPAFFIGFAAAITGIALLSFSDAGEITFNPRGDILAVLAAITWAFYCLVINKLLSKGYHPLKLTRQVFGYGLILMLPIMWVMDYQLRLAELLKPLNLFNLLFLGLIASAMCYLTWSLGVKLIGTIKASAYLYASPVVTVILAMIILDEKINAQGWLGIILTLLGLFISQQGTQFVKRLRSRLPAKAHSS